MRVNKKELPLRFSGLDDISVIGLEFPNDWVMTSVGPGSVEHISGLALFDNLTGSKSRVD